MQYRTTLFVIILLALLAAAMPVLAEADTGAALEYLKTQQNPDGGFGSGFSPDSTIASTADALSSIIAVGGNPADFNQDGNTPLTYLKANALSATTAGDLAKLVLATIATGQNPRQFGESDSVAKLESLLGPDGKIGTQADTFVSHILAVLALASAERPVPAASIDLIKNAQQENGSWAWDGTAATTGDTNSTAFAVQALIAAGEAADSEAVTQALAYYKSVQNNDGGWPYQNPSSFGTETDTNSTAVTIQAIIASGQDAAGGNWISADGNTPVSALEALQNESGAFAWQAAVPEDNLLATLQALPAVAGKAFPLATMDVGEPAAPMAMPETGGAPINPVLALMLSGLALVGGSYALRRADKESSS